VTFGGVILPASLVVLLAFSNAAYTKGGGHGSGSHSSGGHSSSGHHSSNDSSTGHSAGTSPPTAQASTGAASTTVGIGGGRNMSGTRFTSSTTKYRYYCPEAGLYYPDIAQCPSGFRGITE